MMTDEPTIEDYIKTNTELQAEIGRYREALSVLAKEVGVLQAENANLRAKMSRLGGPFICGVAGSIDADGMNKFVFVSPITGVNGFATYMKIADYSEPGY